MSKTIVLDHSQWNKLRAQLRKDYKPSDMLIRSNMRRTLGFVDREHSWYVEGKGYQHQICLDFFDDQKKVLFLLKYSSYIQKDQHLVG